jgi:hypothetical protein
MLRPDRGSLGADVALNLTIPGAASVQMHPLESAFHHYQVQSVGLNAFVFGCQP